MTLQDIESKIACRYHRGAGQKQIIQMWELIGDNYRIEINPFNPNHKYIIIPTDIVKEIKLKVNKTVFNLGLYCDNHGHAQMISESQWEENWQRWSKYMTPPKQEPYGIYCIKYHGEIIYIGMTTISFKQRWSQHMEHFKKRDGVQLLYTAPVKVEDLEFCVMVDLTQEKADIKLEERDIKAMEMGMIAFFKPKYNVSGVKIPYRFKKG